MKKESMKEKNEVSIEDRKDFWDGIWNGGLGKWDIGYAALPIVEYVNGIDDKEIKILIPGAGNAYEAEYLHKQGFKNVYVLDIAEMPIENLKKRVPDFPGEHLLMEDFFEHSGQYDLIIEQTFFIAIEPRLRPVYAKKMKELLNTGGHLVGLLIFDDKPDYTKEGPPFVDTRNEYRKHFDGLFEVRKFETAYNSIKPRAGREVFIDLVKD